MWFEDVICKCALQMTETNTRSLAQSCLMILNGKTWFTAKTTDSRSLTRVSSEGYVFNTFLSSTSIAEDAARIQPNSILMQLRGNAHSSSAMQPQQ